MLWPNFFLTGPNKTGSTSLYSYLRQHPQIYLPQVKEPSYFSAYGFDERDWWIGPPRRRPDPTLAQYQAIYSGVSNEIAIGDASTSSFSSAACERIAAQLPDARLIAVLRQPVDRAYSRFLHCRRSGIEPLADFGMAYRASDQRADQNWYPGLSYHTPGLYSRVLSHFYAHFPRSQVRVYLFDDLQQNATELMRDLYAFLGVATDFLPDQSTVYNRAHTPRYDWLQPLRGRRSYHRWARTLGAPAYRWLRRKLLEPAPPLEPALRLALTEAYVPEIHALERLLDRDLTHWLTPQPRNESAL